MTADDAAHLLRCFADHGIVVWVDGGWAVDALLGAQTRRHADLDIALEHADVPQLRALLAAQGFVDVPRDDTREENFVLGDAYGRQVDVHSFTFDAAGRCIFGCPYPPDSLTGLGVIGGVVARCISAEWLVQFHTGYPHDADDKHDVFALCARFQIALPPEYRPGDGDRLHLCGPAVAKRTRDTSR
ncbi:MAG: aminoglycoside nucleotidyltransferase [Oscillochloris sp.]|nr:aminoglycoside nucleotidyltransferase [Oscillochloris sp.]